MFAYCIPPIISTSSNTSTSGCTRSVTKFNAQKMWEIFEMHDRLNFSVKVQVIHLILGKGYKKMFKISKSSR